MNYSLLDNTPKSHSLFVGNRHRETLGMRRHMAYAKPICLISIIALDSALQTMRLRLAARPARQLHTMPIVGRTPTDPARCTGCGRV